MKAVILVVAKRRQDAKASTKIVAIIQTLLEALQSSRGFGTLKGVFMANMEKVRTF